MASEVHLHPRLETGRTRPASRIRAAKPWLWPNLLSLDAPIVALLWQILFMRCFHVPLNPASSALLALAVWLIYVADRALDVRDDVRNDGKDASPESSALTPRHDFYRLHCRAFAPLWIALLAVSAWLALTHLDGDVLRHGIALLSAVMVYFALVHCAPARALLRDVPRRIWPKEAAVGVLFALGTSLAAWDHVRTAADVATILLYSALCWINCLAIEGWETRSRIETGEWPVSTASVCVALLAVALFYGHRPVLGGAEMASALAFLGLDYARRRFSLSTDALRVLADAALLSPLLFLPIAGSL